MNGGHQRFSVTLAKVAAMLLVAIIFVAGVPVALHWVAELVPALLLLLVPLVPISIALGLWKRRW